MFTALFPCIPSQDTFLLGASNFQQRVPGAASHPSSFNQSEGYHSSQMEDSSVVRAPDS